MVFDLGQIFLYFTCVVVWMLIILSNGPAVTKMVKRWYRRNIKKEREKTPLEALVERLKTSAKEAMEEERKGGARSKKEVHEFMWRHKGQLQKVNIEIDPALDTAISGSQEDFEKMVEEGNVGRLEDLLNELANPVERQKMKKVDTFTFSRKSVDQMKMVGLTPEELVTKMLRAAGRMD